jgi:co-chaperonin GroES (HSP10)
MLSPLNAFSSVNLYGERLGVIELTEQELPVPEGLLMPNTAFKEHYFVRVVAKGDGRWKGHAEMGPRTLPDVDVGDIVMVQVNPQLTNFYTVADKSMVVMHWGDALAKITDTSVPLSTKTVIPVGRWVFADVRLATKSDNIFLPDDSSAAAITTCFISAGKQTDMDTVAPGSRIYIDLQKASRFSLGNFAELVLNPAEEGAPEKRKLVYLSVDYVLGLFESAEDSEVVGRLI